MTMTEKEEARTIKNSTMVSQLPWMPSWLSQAELTKCHTSNSVPDSDNSKEEKSRKIESKRHGKCATKTATVNSASRSSEIATGNTDMTDR
jgi:hypothetical protein